MKKYKRTVDRVGIYMSGSDEDEGVREIGRRHRKQGYLGIGYHFVIRLNGDLEIGRSLMKPDTQNVRHNASSISICVVGSMSPQGKQDDTLTDLLEQIRTRYRFESPSLTIEKRY